MSEQTKKVYRSFETFFGQPIVLACDGNCKKAWGMNNRPKLYRNVNGDYITTEDWGDESIIPDMDDYCYLADHELGDAPDDPGVYEGGHAKPEYAEDDQHNKWCARECERCEMEDSLEDVELNDFSKRFYNKSPHYRDEIDS